MKAWAERKHRTEPWGCVISRSSCTWPGPTYKCLQQNSTSSNLTFWSRPSEKLGTHSTTRCIVASSTETQGATRGEARVLSASSYKLIQDRLRVSQEKLSLLCVSQSCHLQGETEWVTVNMQLLNDTPHSLRTEHRAIMTTMGTHLLASDRPRKALYSTDKEAICFKTRTKRGEPQHGEVY